MTVVDPRFSPLVLWARKNSSHVDPFKFWLFEICLLLLTLLSLWVVVFLYFFQVLWEDQPVRTWLSYSGSITSRLVFKLRAGMLHPAFMWKVDWRGKDRSCCSHLQHLPLCGPTQLWGLGWIMWALWASVFASVPSVQLLGRLLPSVAEWGWEPYARMTPGTIYQSTSLLCVGGKSLAGGQTARQGIQSQDY